MQQLLSYSKRIDIRLIPESNPARQQLLKALDDYDNVMSWLWDDNTEFLNPIYSGPHKEFNDFIIKWKDSFLRQFGVNGTYSRTEEKQYLIEALSSVLMTNKWAQDKEIYQFHEELELDLADSEEIQLPIRMLDKLPYNHFYIDFAENGIFKQNFKGAFVSIIKNGDGYSLIFQRFTKDETAMFGNANLLPYLSKNGDGIFVFRKDEARPERADVPRDADWNLFSFFALNAILYLCAKNAEIAESKQTKDTYKKRSVVKNKYSELRKWECGFRYGATISNLRKENITNQPRTTSIESDSVNARKTPVAHTRRAHWQHYWTGPKSGKQTLILKWKAPVRVGYKDQDDVVATIRRVI